VTNCRRNHQQKRCGIWRQSVSREGSEWGTNQEAALVDTNRYRKWLSNQPENRSGWLPDYCEIMWFYWHFEFAERLVSKYTLINNYAIFWTVSTANGVWICAFAPRKYGTICKNIRHMFSFRHFRDRHRRKKVEPLLRVCGIAHCTWLSFDTKHEGSFIVSRLTKNIEGESTETNDLSLIL